MWWDEEEGVNRRGCEVEVEADDEEPEKRSLFIALPEDMLGEEAVTHPPFSCAQTQFSQKKGTVVAVVAWRKGRRQFLI